MTVPKRDEEQQYRIPMVFVALPALLSLLDDQLTATTADWPISETSCFGHS